MDKKVYLCNKVVRCSKAQHTNEFALSLNRYHKIGTFLFYSDTQLDTVFLNIRGKDTKFFGLSPHYRTKYGRGGCNFVGKFGGRLKQELKTEWCIF